MAELVGGAFLSSFLQVAFERLASHDFRDYFRRRKMDGGLLKKLDASLLSVDKIVEDAEERQYRDHRVKQWLDKLKDEVFNAQDLLEDIATEALRQKLHGESQTSIIRKVRGFFTCVVNRNQFDKEIESGIQGVLNNIEYLIKQNDILGLREGPSAGIHLGVNRKVYERLPTTRLIDESDMYGRDADKERIVELLLSQSMGGNQLPMDVIAITGMGGMGKTTLAKLVYEDVKMKDQFEHRAWVCVSQEFDVDRVTKATLQSLDCPTEQLHDLHSYQLKLKETLLGKKFFLILDDVWNENHKIWEVFQAPLTHAAPQSKILVTTRSQKVVEVMGCTISHPLKPLEDGDCWSLFAKHAFNNQHHAADPDLIQIGKEIVKRCGGLPLVIKTLGSLLHRKLSFQYWDKILKSDLWELSENDIIPSLRLSYHHLPSNLKRCFAYCSIFPKDYNIDKNVLIQLWMADGLIYPTQKRMSLEEAGNEMFNDLESRSFFEPSRKGDDYFTMHDLVSDLAKSVTQEFFVQQEVDQAQHISTKTRYFSYINKKYGNLKILEEVFKCHRLRAFLLLDLGISYKGYTTVHVVSGLSRLKYIRELSLRGYKNYSKNWTVCISNMKHLHYLDLSRALVKKLPNSMCSLINLQTLKLRDCYPLTELPSNFYKLINLRHLDLEGCRLQEMPKYMGKLNQLRTMNKFVVAKKRGSNIKELGALKHLTGSLAISNMKCIKDVANIREANLKAKQLHTLELLYGQYIYSEDHYSREGVQRHEHILEALEPNHNVKKLTVGGYGGTKFPKWLASASQFLPNVVSLYLSCPNIVNLPPLGQLPSLQKLTLARLDGIKVIGEELYGNGSSIAPFPYLSYLQISWMREWEEWDICYEGKSFPCLEQLHIIGCSRLKKSLPQHLPCLKELYIRSCGNLVVTPPKSSCIEELSLIDCPAMESLPQGRMLSSLRRLSIRWCSKLIVSCRDWGMHELLSLKKLEIGGIEDMECFLEEELLPPNLQSLSFCYCENMKRINYRGLVHLHSLTSLSIEFCRSMSFEGMPEDGLPPSLSHLSIYNCPLLMERCEKEKGPDWHLIAHIPHIDMDWCP